MLKLILEFIRDNDVYAENTDVLTLAQHDYLISARKAGFIRVENARFTLTSEGKSYLGM